MGIRPTQSSTFALIKNGLFVNFGKLATAQEQVASGKRILRPSDDPLGASQALAFRQRLAGQERFKAAAQDGRNWIDTAAVALQNAVGLLTDAREALLQGMNGTQTPTDRGLIAGQIRLIRDGMLSIANTKAGDRYLFGGTANQAPPFVASSAGTTSTVGYQGNEQEQQIVVGFQERVSVTMAGSQVFAKQDRTGTSYAGLTGVAAGTSADQGTGFDYLDVRHDATSGAIGLGVQLVLGGASDTILGAHTIVIDATTSTVRLDNGTAMAIPAATDADVADFTVLNEHGAEIHLDFSAYAGGSATATVTGDGSISLDGINYTALDFAQADLQLVDSQTGSVVHVDTTGIHRAGRELLTFGGTVNVFDVLQGIANDLDNVDGLDSQAQLARLNTWLDELDRNQQNILNGTGSLGSRSQHLSDLETRVDDAAAEVKGRLSQVEDADFSQVVLDMTRAEQTLQLAQATSVRLLQNSLLNFLR